MDFGAGASAVTSVVESELVGGSRFEDLLNSNCRLFENAHFPKEEMPATIGLRRLSTVSVVPDYVAKWTSVARTA